MTTEQRIAVLGSQGQLGSELLRQLGEAAIPFGRHSCDLGDFPATREALLRANPSAVINAAGYTKVDLAEQEARECMRVNADAVENLAKVCAELGCTLLQVSTDYVFGADEGRRTPYTEEDAPAPQGVYARSKLAGEQAAATWKQHITVRTCGLFGLRTRPSHTNFVDTVLRLSHERDRLRVVSDQQCTPSYTCDIARALLFLVKQTHYGVFHTVNGGSTTWFEFAREVLRLALVETAVEPISTSEYGAPAKRPGYSVLDTRKYHALDGPRLPAWPHALARYIETHHTERRTAKSDTSRAA
jgi:dTDP-4-dehydrorhamnose reductase